MASLFTRPCTSPATMQASKISSAGQFTALPLSSPRPRRCLMQLRAPAAAFGSGSGVCDATGNLKLHSGSARAAVCTRAVRAGSTADASDALALQHIAEITRQVDAALATILQDNAESAQQPRQQHSSPLRSKVVAAIDKLSKGLLERETEVRLLLLSALCGEHLLLLGPPGTAKSELSRRLNSLVGGTYYERLLTRFSVPEELFGPLSMRGLENDQYVRQTDGYLPTAEVAFVDEIFKANSAILNALLTLLNERLFDNGNQRHKAPLMTLVGASNELPESEELDALYDRFLIRRQVAQVSNSQLAKLARMAAGRPDPVVSTATAGEEISHLTVQEFKDAPDQAYAEVDVPDSVVDIIVNLRNYLQDKCEPPIYVSDRRFMKAIQMLQVVAFGDGRDEVTEFDCLLLEHVFGNRPDDCHKVRAHVLEIIASDPGLQQAELVFLGLFGRALRLMGPDTPSTSDLSEAVLEAGSLAALLRSRHAALALALDAGFPELKSSVWQSEGAVQGAVQGLTPQMTENRKKVEELLREALVLQACLERASTAASAGQPAGPVGQLLERLLPKRLKQYQKGIAAPAATAGAK